jgi:hypothetical protein
MPAELEIPHGVVATPMNGESAAIGTARDLGRELAKLRERWQPMIFMNYVV